MMITTCVVLPVNTPEGSWVEKKRQCSLSNINFFKLFRGKSVQGALSPNAQTTNLHTAQNFWTKSEQNLVLGWMVPLESVYDEYKKSYNHLNVPRYESTKKSILTLQYLCFWGNYFSQKSRLTNQSPTQILVFLSRKVKSRIAMEVQISYL